jgi:Holliday junction DNA helicase RuvA
MIGFLRGHIVEKQPPHLVIDVQGIGYEVEAPLSTFFALESADGEVRVLTHLHVREDAMLLYGFASEEERLLFRTLIKVNGVGAKMALAILSSMSVEDFCCNVEQENSMALTKIPGVGKKTAERLVIEMRDRLKNSGLKTVATAPTAHPQSGQSARPLATQQSAVEALVALGYTSVQAETLIEKVAEPELSLEALIKKALQQVNV